MEPAKQKKLLSRISDEVKRTRERGVKAVFLTSPEIRSIFSTIVSSIIPSAAVLSSFEIVPDIKLEAVGNIAL
jgi:flagellar biosynthesis component FlhA